MYPCTVALNPEANVKALAEWFPRARVCVLEDNEFRWVRGEPGHDRSVPHGTTLADDG